MARVKRRMDFRIKKWRRLRARIYRRDDFSCRGCGWSPGKPEGAYDGRYTIRGYNGERWTWLMLDHITPVCQGGRDAAENLQTLCESCNCRKSGHRKIMQATLETETRD